MKSFGKSRIDLALDEQRRLNLTCYNKKKVKENREVSKDLINATCFLERQELAFGGNDKSASFSNSGNYIELLDVLSERETRGRLDIYVRLLHFLEHLTEYEVI